jgi:hypothetical protein
MQVPTLSNKPEQHIDNATAGFMVATALFFDALDVVPAALMTAATGAATAVGSAHWSCSVRCRHDD